MIHLNLDSSYRQHEGLIFGIILFLQLNMKNSVYNLKDAKEITFYDSKVKICSCSIIDPYFIISVCLLIIWHQISEVAVF